MREETDFFPTGKNGIYIGTTDCHFFMLLLRTNL